MCHTSELYTHAVVTYWPDAIVIVGASLQFASSLLLPPMSESELPPPWLDDLLSGVTIDSLLFDINSKDMDDSQQTILQLSPGAIAQQMELVSSAEVENIAAKPAEIIPYPKQAIQASTSMRSVSVRSDKARKMEIEKLKLEVPKLEAYIDYLMQKAVNQSGEHSSLYKKLLINAKLRELTRLQQLWSTRGLSVASSTSSHPSLTFLNSTIHLPRDVPTRIKILCDLSSDILRDGRKILHERERFMSGDLLPCNEVSSYTTNEGDTCVSVFDATPIEGAENVKEVFTPLLSMFASGMDFVSQKTWPYSLTNIVDSYSDLDQSGIAHRWSMRVSPTGVATEFNRVLFSEYHAGSTLTQEINKQEQGMIIIHPIGDDELYPYTTGRMRLDVTSIISIRHQKYSRDESNSHLGSCSSEGFVVVRATYIKLHLGGVSISASELQKEMDFVTSKGKAALQGDMALFKRHFPCESTN